MQFRDLYTQYQILKNEIDEEIQEVISSSEFILGKKVIELEEKLAVYVGRKYCVTCGNGTDALQLALMVMDIGIGDAIFTSDFTYFASAGCASILGATPIFVDIDLKTFNISPEALETSIQNVLSEGKLLPKVIIPVDLFGQPANYIEIEKIAKKYNLKILEDGAQGFGGNINGKRVCSFGDISITSFFPAKPLGCYGDGGAIFTDNIEIAERLRSLRVQGKSPNDKYDNREIGINSRLDTIQAAILLPKFKAFVEYELEAVNKVAEWYTKNLQENIVVPYVPEGFYSSWAQYTILCKDSEKRITLQKYLKENYIWMKLSDERYLNTIEATQRVLSLPIHPYLKEETVEFIADIINLS